MNIHLKLRLVKTTFYSTIYLLMLIPISISSFDALKSCKAIDIYLNNYDCKSKKRQSRDDRNELVSIDLFVKRKSRE